MTTDALTAAIRHLFAVMSRTPYVPREIVAAASEIRAALDVTSGADLVTLREAAKLSQAAVARAMGVTPQYLGRVERKLTVTLSTKTAYLAAIKKCIEGDPE
jgi:DNA-binding transcriptional regulator YiaG